MKNCLLLGMVMMAYGLSSPVFSSDTATLTIMGKVTAPTCSTDIINTQLQQRCGNTLYGLNAQDLRSLSSARGVTTEIIAIAGTPERQIVLNRYD